MSGIIHTMRARCGDMAERMGAPRDTFDAALADLIKTAVEGSSPDEFRTAVVFGFGKAAQQAGSDVLGKLDYHEVFAVFNDTLAAAMAQVVSGIERAAEQADPIDALRVLLNCTWSAFGPELADAVAEEVPDVAAELRRRRDAGE